jgi:hypothetical protein
LLLLRGKDLEEGEDLVLESEKIENLWLKGLKSRGERMGNAVVVAAVVGRGKKGGWAAERVGSMSRLEERESNPELHVSLSLS